MRISSKKNNELYEEISDLKKELEKIRGGQNRRSSFRRHRERSRSRGSRVKGRSISQSVCSPRGNRLRSRSTNMKRSRTGSIRRKHSRLRSQSRSVRRSLSRRRSISCSIWNNPVRPKRRMNRSTSPRPRRGKERVRSRSPPRRNIVYANLPRRRWFSPIRRNSPYRRSPRR